MSSRKANTGKRAGLTQQAIVDKALELTKREGLDGWSMRQLGRELNVVNSVIYHYFPSKNDLCDAVVDRVLKMINLPATELDWKQWFSQLLRAARPVMTTYRGVIDRFKTGRYTPAVLPAVDIACNKLLAAGFGVLTPLALSMISNVTIHTISARNMRLPGQQEADHYMQTLLAHFSTMAEQSPGMRLMLHGLFEHLTDSENERAISDIYFELIIASLLDGIEHIMIPQAAQVATGFPCCDSAIRPRNERPQP